MHRKHRTLLASCLFFLLPCVAGGQSPEDYVPGDLIVVFNPAYMPTAQSVSFSPPAFDIQSLDTLLLHFDCISQRKFIDTYEPESDYDVTRMFLLHFPDSSDNGGHSRSV